MKVVVRRKAPLPSVTFEDQRPVWFEGRLSGGALGVYRCWQPDGGVYMERLERAFAPGEWSGFEDQGGR